MPFVCAPDWGQDPGLEAPPLPLAASLSFPTCQVQMQPWPCLPVNHLLCSVQLHTSRQGSHTFERVCRASQLASGEDARRGGGRGGSGNSAGMARALGRATGLAPSAPEERGPETTSKNSW